MLEENYLCPKKQEGCISNFDNFNNLLSHIQYDCSYFSSKYYPVLPKSIKNPDTHIINNITKYLLQNEEHTLEEKPDLYFIQSTQPQRNRILKKSDKQIKSGPQKFAKDKELLETENIEISKCILKSGIFAVEKISFDSCLISNSNSTYTNKKRNKYLLAYPSNNYEIIIKDIIEITNQQIVLKGHKDYITEIKFFLIKSMSFLFSCSYDNTCNIWKISSSLINSSHINNKDTLNINFELIDTINYYNWANSVTCFVDKFKTGDDIAIISGGFSSNIPVRIYSLYYDKSNYYNKCISDIKIKNNNISICVFHYHDEISQKTYIFNSVENESESSLLMFDFHSKKLLRTFPADKYVTKMQFYNDNINSIIITYVDFKGSLRQYNANTGKLIKQLNLGTNCFDLVSFDEEYFICCGDHNDHSFKIIYKDGLNLVKTYPHIHNNVILNLAVIDIVCIGKVLISLGADKQINIYKKA